MDNLYALNQVFAAAEVAQLRKRHSNQNAIGHDDESLHAIKVAFERTDQQPVQASGRIDGSASCNRSRDLTYERSLPHIEAKHLPTSRTNRKNQQLVAANDILYDQCAWLRMNRRQVVFDRANALE